MTPFQYGLSTKWIGKYWTDPVEYHAGHVEPPKGRRAIYLYNGKRADITCIAPHDKGDWTYSWPKSRVTGPLPRGRKMWQEGHVIPEDPRYFWWYRDGHRGRPNINMQEKRWEYSVYEEPRWMKSKENIPHTDTYKGIIL